MSTEAMNWQMLRAGCVLPSNESLLLMAVEWSPGINSFCAWSKFNFEPPQWFPVRLGYVYLLRIPLWFLIGLGYVETDIFGPLNSPSSWTLWLMDIDHLLMRLLDDGEWVRCFLVAMGSLHFIQLGRLCSATQWWGREETPKHTKQNLRDESPNLPIYI